MTINERIKLIRESKNISQADLAKSLHISKSFMNRLENGSSTLSLPYIIALANALDVTPQEILCDIFVYDDSISTAEEIKNLAEQFSPEHQQLILDSLKFFYSRMYKV